MRSGNLNWRVKAGLMVSLCLVIVRFGLVPLYEWQDQALERIKALQRTVSKKKALAGNERKIEAELQRARSFFNKVLKFYYSDFADPHALQLVLQKKIEAISARCGVNIKSTDWLYPTGDDVVQAPIKVRCDGQPLALLNFIKSIEEDDHFLSIDRINITANRRQGTLLAEFDISAFGTMIKKKE